MLAHGVTSGASFDAGSVTGANKGQEEAISGLIGTDRGSGDAEDLPLRLLVRGPCRQEVGRGDLCPDRSRSRPR